MFTLYLYRSPKCKPSTSKRLSRSGSVPNLSEKARLTSALLKPSGSPNNRRMSRHHHHNNHHNHHRHHGSILNRMSRENNYLHPGLLRYHRHAISVDETTPLRKLNDSTHGSQCSVTFDPTPEIIDIVPVHKKRHPKRSDTSRRHLLSRQRQIEREEQMLQNTNANDSMKRERRRRSSTMSDNSVASHQIEKRRASSTSRTNSFDSRCTQNASSINDLYVRSPEKQQIPSNLSMDRDFR